MTSSGFIPTFWRVDAENWLLSPLGTRVARIEDGALKLYDKHAKTSFALTLEDLRNLTQKPEEENKTPE